MKVPALIAGMMAGADSIDDMALFRHGAMGRLFTGVRAPSTLGTFLRAFTFGHVRQLDAVNSRVLAELARRSPLLPGAAGPHGLAYVDIDDTVKPTFGYAKQGAGRGFCGVNGLNALLGIVSTPGSQPVICAARLRKASANSARGAARLIRDALATAKSCGATGTLVLRADSAYYGSDAIGAARKACARFSVTARQDSRVLSAINTLSADPTSVRTPIRYPHAIYDEASGTWVSDAEITETGFTAFTSKAKAKQVAARLIVRRVPDRNPAHHNPLFTVHRYHAVLTDSPLPLVAAEAEHRAHAIVEQVIADLKGGPLAHLPSGKFTANAAWLACETIAHNLLRAAGALAGTFHNHRDPTGPPDQRSRQARPQHPANLAAPAIPVAMAPSLATDGRSHPRRTTPGHDPLTTRPNSHHRSTTWTPGTPPATPACPQPETSTSQPEQPTHQIRRWIRAKAQSS